MIPIYAGLTSQSIDVFIPDSASSTGGGKTGLAYNTASLSAHYRKGATGSTTAITLATLANAQAAYSSGGFIEIDATNQPGMYRLDLPNAAVDTAGLVHVMLKGASGMAPVPVRIDCRAVPANVKQYGDTAGTFSGGRPEIILQDNGITAGKIAALALNGKGDWSLVGSAMTLTSGERSTLTAALESAMLNEADGQALLAAIQSQVQALFDSGADVPVSTLVTLIRDGILNRVLAGNHDTAGSVGKALQDTLADTNELQTDWANGGRLDQILDSADLWSKRAAVLTTGTLTGAGTNTEVYTISALGITATCTTDTSGNRTSVIWS